MGRAVATRSGGARKLREEEQPYVMDEGARKPRPEGSARRRREWRQSSRPSRARSWLAAGSRAPRAPPYSPSPIAYADAAGGAVVRLAATSEPMRRTGGGWTPEEDRLLKEGVRAVGPRNWKRIAHEYLRSRRTDVQCLHRWQKVRACAALASITRSAVSLALLARPSGLALLPWALLNCVGGSRERGSSGRPWAGTRFRAKLVLPPPLPGPT